MEKKISYLKKYLTFKFSYIKSELFKTIKKIWHISFMIMPLIIFLIFMGSLLFGIYPIFIDQTNKFPNILTIKGQITKNFSNRDCYSAIIGGFKTDIDSNGYFKLKFLSKEKKGIPIIIKCENIIKIDYLDYSNFNKIEKKFKVLP